MIILSARNPKWGNDEKTFVDLLVTFETLGEVPFTAHPEDIEQHGKEIFHNAVAGKYGVVDSYSKEIK